MCSFEKNKKEKNSNLSLLRNRRPQFFPASCAPHAPSASLPAPSSELRRVLPQPLRPPHHRRVGRGPAHHPAAGAALLPVAGLHARAGVRAGELWLDARAAVTLHRCMCDRPLQSITALPRPPSVFTPHADILKCLALGASAVMVGRPLLWALTLGGQQGVEEAGASGGSALGGRLPA